MAITSSRKSAAPFMATVRGSSPYKFTYGDKAWLASNVTNASAVTLDVTRQAGKGKIKAALKRVLSSLPSRRSIRASHSAQRRIKEAEQAEKRQIRDVMQAPRETRDEMRGLRGLAR